MKKTQSLVVAISAVLLFSAPALAEEEVISEVAFIFNTFSFLISGVLVMWMAAGFAMLEAGMVRTKNVATICLKNISLYSIAGILYYLIGYNLMYSGVDGGFFGSLGFWGPEDAAALAGDFSAGYASGSDWFFQMVFVATAASVVSGTVAERIRLWPFLIFVVVLTGLIYPIQGAWSWGGGWLAGIGFSDYAGSTIVHSVGGWAALTGAIVLGARKGKYGIGGRVNPMPGSSMPLATLGTFILWLGWFGFNGGSVLALGSADAAVEMSVVYLNTNLAAAAGLVAAMITLQGIYKRVDLSMALNGALAGLVSITAGPATPSPGAAVLIGAVGGVLVVLAVPIFDKMRIDDVVGALSVHLVCGVWGTLAVPFTDADASFLSQLIGVVAVGVFVSATSFLGWLALKYTMGIRVTEEEESAGSDTVELGLEAYPEFGRGSQGMR